MRQQFHSSSNSNNQQLRQRFRAVWRAVANFMQHRPQPSAQSPVQSLAPTPGRRYSTKASLYPYLPASEEERDWLERLYHLQ